MVSALRRRRAVLEHSLAGVGHIQGQSPVATGSQEYSGRVPRCGYHESPTIPTTTTRSTILRLVAPQVPLLSEGLLGSVVWLNCPGLKPIGMTAELARANADLCLERLIAKLTCCASGWGWLTPLTREVGRAADCDSRRRFRRRSRNCHCIDRDFSTVSATTAFPRSL